MEKLTVELGDRSYDIEVADGLLKKTGSLLKNIGLSGKLLVATDKNVAPLYLETVSKSLEDQGFVVDSIVFEAGEQTKSFANLELLLDKAFANKPERGSSVLALGGGVIGDLTGFAASILLRGVNFIQVPTTLLSQVDSSVGGKTAINNKFGKNLVGSFYQPKIVIIDTHSLNSLPKREYLAGYAEVLKYGLIWDKDFFDLLDSNIDKIISHDQEFITNAIVKSCQVKAEIVSQDEKESGIRALLNLGHTFGHVLEKQTGYSDKLLHGEAVAVGMVLAAEFSSFLGFFQNEDVLKICNHLQKVGLPTKPSDIKPDWDVDEVINDMFHDKKVSNGKLVFILLETIGKSIVKPDVEIEALREFLNEQIK